MKLHAGMLQRELEDAGVGGLINWDGETGAVYFPSTITPAQRAAVAAVLAAHDPVAAQSEWDKRQANETTKARLRDIDIASVRALREYLATKADAPLALKEREAEAVTERAKLR